MVPVPAYPFVSIFWLNSLGLPQCPPDRLKPVASFMPVVLVSGVSARLARLSSGNLGRSSNSSLYCYGAPVVPVSGSSPGRQGSLSMPQVGSFSPTARGSGGGRQQVIQAAASAAQQVPRVTT